MGDKSGIEWTDATWNPTTGCDQVSPGCDNCYAMAMAKRLKAMGSPKYQKDGNPRTSGPGFGLTEHWDMLDQPTRWKKPRRIFVNSMSDLFHREVSLDFQVQVFDIMEQTPRHTFQILTKRPEIMRRRIATIYAELGLTRPAEHIWLGTSIENNKFVNRADHLRLIPSVRFLSLEPLLGPLPDLDLHAIDWVIVGGESGPGARPMHPDWVRHLRDYCVRVGVAFHFKQWGCWIDPEQFDHSGFDDVEADEQGVSMWPDGRTSELSGDSESVRLWHVNKHIAGRTLDGRTWDEYPVAS